MSETEPVPEDNDPIFLNSTATAAAITGTAIKKAYLAAHSLSIPENKPAVMEEPDLDIPGNKASDSNTPINNAFLNVICLTFFLPLLAYSELHNMKPFMIKKKPTATTLLKSISNCFVNNIPVIAAGMVLTNKSHANFL